MFRPITFDAQAALGFVIAQAVHIEAGVNAMVYPEIQYPGLIPVDTTAHPFTQTVAYYSSDMFGQARWINGNSDDIPMAGTERARFQTPVYTAGIGYGFGWEEINHAMLMGVNLQADDAAAARRAYEEFTDTIALRGDTTKGFNGLINYPGVTVAAAPNGDWEDGTKTDTEILEDINTALSATLIGTNYTSMANTLLMSPGRMLFLATRRLGDTERTLLDWLRANNVYTAQTRQPLDIRAVAGLETSGAGGVQRMVAYRKAPDVLKLHIPMPHRFLTVYQDGPLHWVVPGVFRMGGLDVRRPAEVRYIDGI